jgi:dTDP-glucose 4,6-dehydratase
MTILVTGGAGFIGSNFVRAWLGERTETVVNLDKLTYAGDRANLAGMAGENNHVFVEGDIGDRVLVSALLNEHRPRAIINFAAESHVDRSIAGPMPFIATNVVGATQLLEASKQYCEQASAEERAAFRFVQISTDEVYGSLGPAEEPSDEHRPYAPNNPYAASKAGADHLARAYFRTFGLPVIVTNCSNNFGPFQFPEKLIPLTISRALSGGTIPVYGDGLYVRDWLYVEDHCAAIRAILDRGQPGECYNIGGLNELPNIEIVRLVCSILDEISPETQGRPHARHIAHVKDRPGHDRRYAIDSRKISVQLGWKPVETFESAMRKTIRWYVENPQWVQLMNKKLASG